MDAAVGSAQRAKHTAETAAALADAAAEAASTLSQLQAASERAAAASAASAEAAAAQVTRLRYEPDEPPPQQSRPSSAPRVEDILVRLAPDPSVLPAGYGAWEDWNDPFSVALEEMIATEHNLPLAYRGPNPAHPNSPELWGGIPFNFLKTRIGSRKSSTFHGSFVVHQQAQSLEDPSVGGAWVGDQVQ